MSKPPHTSLRDVQALRGIAAAMVMCYHTGTIVAASTDRLLFGNLFRGGFLGVDVFFVLSGFVMYWMHGHEFGAPAKVPVFFKKRLARIFPIYWMVVLAKALKDRAMPDTLVFVSALLLIPYPHVPYINVAWTLSYELFFYGALACMIALPRGWPTLLPPAALLVLALWPSPVEPSQAFIPTLLAFPFNPHLLEFLFGLAVGWAARRPFLPRRWWRLTMGIGALGFLGGVAAATVLAMRFDGMAPGQAYRLAELETNSLFRNAIWLMGIPFSVLLLGLVLEESHTGSRRIPGLDWLGDISYSLYLVHGFVIAFLMQNRWVAGLVSSHQAAVFGVMLAAVAASATCHYALEKPFIRLLKPWASRA